LYSLPSIVQVVKSRRMRWAGHVWGRGEVCTGFWWGDLRERDHWGDPHVDGEILMDLQEVGGGCGDWIELAQDRERCRALVSMAMNFRVP
jgi:hypothetical protein